MDRSIKRSTSRETEIERVSYLFLFSFLEAWIWGCFWQRLDSLDRLSEDLWCIRLHSEHTWVCSGHQSLFHSPSCKACCWRDCPVVLHWSNFRYPRIRSWILPYLSNNVLEGLFPDNFSSLSLLNESCSWHEVQDFAHDSRRKEWLGWGWNEERRWSN